MAKGVTFNFGFNVKPRKKVAPKSKKPAKGGRRGAANGS